MSAMSFALKFVAENAAKGAVSWAGGEAAGFVFNLISGSHSDEYEVIQKLGTQLNSIRQGIASLESQLHDLSEEILDMLRDIEQEELYIAWSIVNTNILEYMTQIRVQYGRYVQIARNPDGTSEASIENLVSEILNTNNGAEISLVNINQLILGQGEQRGVLKLWQEMLQPLVHARKRDWHETIVGFQNYYRLLALAQSQAANLLVEAFNHRDENSTAAEKWREFIRLMDSQEQPYNMVSELLFSSWLINTNVPGRESSFYYGLGVFSPGVLNEFYRPSPERVDNETIFASIKSDAEGTARIVVQMMYLQFPQFSVFPNLALLDRTAIQLVRDDDPSGNPIRATKVDQFSAGSPLQGPHRVRRFVFEGLSDGNYRIKNINGENGLDPVPGPSGRVAFLSDRFLNHLMTIGVGHQFDFMDFTAYSLPLAVVSVQEVNPVAMNCLAITSLHEAAERLRRE